MRTKKLKGTAYPSPMPFVMMVVVLDKPIISFKYVTPYLIKHLAYDDPFKGAEAIGMEKVKRVVGNNEIIPVEASYSLESGEFLLREVFLASALLLVAVLWVYFGTLAK